MDPQITLLLGLLPSYVLNEVGQEVGLFVDPFNIQVMNVPESEDEEAISEFEDAE